MGRLVGAVSGASPLSTLFVNALDHGVTGDGSTDDSAAIQAVIDANKGQAIFFPAGYRYVMAGVTLDGSTYDDTTLTFEGEMLLKVRATDATNTFGGAYIGLLIKECDNVTLCFRGDGNRANQPTTDEHIYLVATAGATNLKIPYFYGREVRGDGLYLSSTNYTTESAPTKGVIIDSFDCVNSDFDGRNALSIISAEDVAIGTFRSYKVGGVVDSVRMPGGFDIEPDHVWQSCKNITVGSINVVTAGTAGLAIHGKTGTDVTSNVLIGVANVETQHPSDELDGNNDTTINEACMLKVNWAKDVTVRSFSGTATVSYGIGVNIDDVENVVVSGRVRHVWDGVRIGRSPGTTEGTPSINVDVDIQVSECARYGFSTGRLENCKIRGVVDTPVGSLFPGSMFAVLAEAYTQNNVEYGVTVRAHADWLRSYRNGGGSITLNNVYIKDCDLTGTWSNYVYQVGDLAVPRINVKGVTDQASTPSVGSGLWATGQVIWNSDPATTEPIFWVFDGSAFQIGAAMP